MAELNWKYETGAWAAKRFWQEIAESRYQEGREAPAGARCPYPLDSFAGIHWRRGRGADKGDEQAAGRSALAQIRKNL